MNFTGTITVPLPLDQAIALFTPEGERAWVPGWDPHHHSDTVFTTDHGGTHTIWLILDTEPHADRYARVSHDRAGTVEVRCHPDGAYETRAFVTYDLTALGSHTLDDFGAGYPAMLAEWERMIAAACTASR